MKAVKERMWVTHISKKKSKTCFISVVFLSLIFSSLRQNEMFGLSWWTSIRNVCRRMFWVKGWSLRPPPLTLFFPSSLSWSKKYPFMRRRYLPVCLCQPKIWVTGLLSSDASVSLTNTLNEHVCACIEIWTFYTRRVGGFMHLCVWLRGVGLGVRSVYDELELLLFFSSQQWSVHHSRKHLSLLVRPFSLRSSLFSAKHQ